MSTKPWYVIESGQNWKGNGKAVGRAACQLMDRGGSPKPLRASSCPPSPFNDSYFSSLSPRWLVFLFSPLPLNNMHVHTNVCRRTHARAQVHARIRGHTHTRRHTHTRPRWSPLEAALPRMCPVSLSLLNPKRIIYPDVSLPDLPACD